MGGPVTSGREVTKALAYGGDNGDVTLQGAMAMLMNPDRTQDTENKAFWAGMTGPQTGGMSGVSNAMAAQVAAREAQDKLRAAYIPMIMQTMTQQRANDLGYAKMMQDTLKEVNPKVDSALSALQAGSVDAQGNRVPIQAAHAHSVVNNHARMYGLPGAMFGAHHNEIDAATDSEGNVDPNYLTQVRLRGAPAEAGLAKESKNAAGQTTFGSAATGTVAPAIVPSGVPSAGHGAVNPTLADNKAADIDLTDAGKYEEALRGAADTYGGMRQRLNAVVDASKDIVPGKYAGVANSVGAALKDLSERFPSLKGSDTLNNAANALTGSGTGKGDPVASSQIMKSMAVMETISQIKASLANENGTSSGRLTVPEFNKTLENNPGLLTSPEALTRFATIIKGLHTNALNKYSSWADYRHSVPRSSVNTIGFDAGWSKKEAQALDRGGFGDTTTPGVVPLGDDQVPNGTNPPAGGVKFNEREGWAKPGAPAVQKAPPAASEVPAQAPVQFDPNQWEKGAILAPGGRKPVVRDASAPGGWRYAHTSAPSGRLAVGKVE
jgi:hypothetical protein